MAVGETHDLWRRVGSLESGQDSVEARLASIEEKLDMLLTRSAQQQGMTKLGKILARGAWFGGGGAAATGVMKWLGLIR